MFMYVCMHACISVCVYVCIYIYICVCACACVHACVYNSTKYQVNSKQHSRLQKSVNDIISVEIALSTDGFVLLSRALNIM